MASGWAGDGAVQDQIQDSINDEVARARRNLPKGESLHFCEECGEPIPEARRKALPGVRLCVACQEEADKDQRAVSLYNRRGSKDSQWRERGGMGRLARVLGRGGGAEGIPAG